MNGFLRTAAAVVLALATAVAAWAQNDPDAGKSDDEKRAELAEIANIEEKIMVPMRDGVRLATHLYTPKGAAEPLPTIFWRTPYQFNTLGGARLDFTLKAVREGYALVMQNERGVFFSEGDWEILGFPRTDGYDALSWISDQDWSNGAVGTIGCSSSAEWQLALAAQDHPAHKAMVPMSPGAGIGRVGPYAEMGNWYRGGAEQMFYPPWLNGLQHTLRPKLPAGLSREEIVELSRHFDMAPERVEADWGEAIRHLPLQDLIANAGGPTGMWSEFVTRTPGDPAWNDGGLYHEDEPIAVPALWAFTWYDVSIDPNIALFNLATKSGKDRETRDNQYMIISPGLHCSFFRSQDENLVVGEREMGDARYDYHRLIFDWFDLWLKGERNGFARNHSKVQYYQIGADRWRTSDIWPPRGSKEMTLFLDSGGRANSLFGDGVLSRTEPAAEDSPDVYVSDPMNPIPSRGGGICCIGDAIDGGVFDQRDIEARADMLVFTSAPLETAVDVTGPVTVTLFVSSDAADADFAIKLVDVQPDGRAFNVHETIKRARYREGYDKTVMMEDGEIYELTFEPLETSIRFDAGHRIRLEVAGSNFPRFARNLQTGGANYDESDAVVAANTVHSSAEHPSRIVLTVAN